MNKSQNKTFEVLEYVLDHGDRTVTPSELAAATKLNAPTCVRILEGLMAYGYVQKKSRREGYLPGPAVFSFTGTNGFYAELLRAADATLRKTAEKLHYRVILTTAAAGRKFLIGQYDPNRAAPLGHAYDDFYSTTSGRLLLAYFSESELAAYLHRHGPPGSVWPEADSEKRLQTQLAKIRTAAHYRFTDPEGNICFAAPLLIPDHPCACISSYVRKESEADAAIAILVTAATAIRKFFAGPAPSAL